MDFLIERRTDILIGLITSAVFSGIVWFISLSRSIPSVDVPFWIIVLVILFPIIVFISSLFPKKTKSIANKKFGVERIHMDGKHLTNCTFDGSELVFIGKNISSMSNCTGNDTRMSFEGAAGNTVIFLSALWIEPGTRHFAQEAINQITKGTTNSHNKSPDS